LAQAELTRDASIPMALSIDVLECLSSEEAETVPARACTPIRTLPEVNPAELERALGDFRLVRELGSGAMGTVYLAEHRAIGSRVAVKVLKPSFASNAAHVEQFYDEARAANRVGHAGIVRIFDLKRVPPSSYALVMEYLEGTPLSARADPIPPPGAAAQILAQVCDALDAAHKAGVVHRDVKADNVFVVRRGRRTVVKLLDFGAARLQPQGDETRARARRSAVLGTPAYMPPEQWRGGSVDGRSDVYATGVLAFRLTTGRLPFDIRGKPAYEVFRAHRDVPPPDPRALNPNIPGALAEVILCALAKRREDRFQSAGEMALALRRAVRAGAKSARARRSRSRGAAPTPTLVATWESAALSSAFLTGATDAAPPREPSAAMWTSLYRACASTSAPLAFAATVEPPRVVVSAGAR
jgi:serine/threonine protein kinase